MVSLSRTTTSCVTKSPSNLALIGMGCGSGMISSLRCRGRLAVLRRPPVVVGVVAHDLRGEAHPCQNTWHVWRLNLAGQQALHDSLIVHGVPVLPPDLAADGRAEVIGVVVVGQGVGAHRVIRVIGCGRRADWEMAKVTEPGQGFGQGAPHVSLV